MAISDNWHVHPGRDCCHQIPAAPVPYVSVQTFMPEIWSSYTCQPCEASLVIGGEQKPAVNCPGCGLPMVFAFTHQTGVSA
jgi:DNA-directed RNA polymerase subunit RPC12/RpoP